MSTVTATRRAQNVNVLHPNFGPLPPSCSIFPLNPVFKSAMDNLGEVMFAFVKLKIPFSTVLSSLGMEVMSQRTKHRLRIWQRKRQEMGILICKQYLLLQTNTVGPLRTDGERY